MYASKYNFVFKVSDEESVVFNPLSGSMDILNKYEVKMLEKLKHGDKVDDVFSDQFMKRGYVFETKSVENDQLKRIYRQFENMMSERGAERSVLIPTYSCNLRCKYCYQPENIRNDEVINDRVLKKYFDTVESLRKKNTPHVQLFGGEPLIYNKTADVVRKTVKETKDCGWNMLIVTNGVELKEFSGILDRDIVEQIQVTIDGIPEYHDKRRVFPDGSGSFEKIVASIDKVLPDIPIILRVNVDKQNIEGLPKLADFIIQKGWLDEKFHTYIAPVKSLSHMNYPLCMPEDGILEDVFKCYTKHPETRIFNLAGWQGVDTIIRTIENGTPFPPQYKNCEANIDLLAFDLYGDVYTCLEVVGRKDFSIGKFYPEQNFNEKLDMWRNRSIFTTNGCEECDTNILCGGGCAILALDSKGSLYEGNCKPVKKSLELAIPFYFDELKRRAGENEKTHQMHDR